MQLQTAVVALLLVQMNPNNFGEATDKLTPTPSVSIQGDFKYNTVAADQPICSQIGSYVLNVRRGNAMDAAVASLLCVGVISAHSAGIGGGSFLVYYSRNKKKSYGLDFRETAPSLANATLFSKRPSNSSTTGGLAIATPGEIAGLHDAWKRFGSLSWASLVKPTEDLLRNGFRVPKSLEKAIQRTEKIIKMPKMASLRDMLTNKETKQFYKEGELMKNEKLANTFALIGKNYSDFYRGKLAHTIQREIQDAGGIITMADLENYRARWRTPIRVTLRDSSTLHSLPPPSSGSILAYIINIMDGYGYTEASRKTLESMSLYWHRLMEAFKFAYSVRSNLGDEDFVDVRQTVKNITSRKYADEIRKKINDSKTFPPEYYSPKFAWKEDHGTTHLSVVDSQGNAVSITSTINTFFGSKIVGSETGILYNNEMDDFSTSNKTNYFGFKSSPLNYIAPNKRPMSSMCPLIVTRSDGTVKLVIGAAGGSRIISAVAQSAIHVLHFNATIKEAIDYPRLHHQLIPDVIHYEANFPAQILRQLERKGHKLKRNGYGSVVQGINKKDTHWYSNCDYRKGGSPSGL